MTLDQLTQLMHEFVASKGWYDDESARPQTPRNIATSLSLEAAEVLEHFQWDERINDKDAFAGELADVALYLIQLASISEIDLGEAVLAKLAINKDREWPTE